MIVCLLNNAELRTIGVDSRQYEESCGQLGIELLRFEMIELAPHADIPAFQDLVSYLVQSIRSGKNVIAHCRGGIGRAGLLACCILLSVGVCTTGAGAIKKVRSLRDKRCVESTR